VVPHSVMRTFGPRPEQGHRRFLAVPEPNLTDSHQDSRWAASACAASSFSVAKNCGDWPAKSPIFVKNMTTPVEIPCVLVGRMIEHFGRVGLRNGHGSGIIKLALKAGRRC
jgi:hypothetical protein